VPEGTVMTAATAAPESVLFREGTHRTATPEQTWSRIEPLLGLAGITRVSDITLLDEIGLPVWQAVRPNSANLTVSQGKGIGHTQARVSAAMESLELACAEYPSGLTRVASVAEIGAEVAYDPVDLPLLDTHVLCADTTMTWLAVQDVAHGARSWWPYEAIAVNFLVRAGWCPPVLRVNSNGLASGNSVAEATLHGLFELVERHALARYRRARDPWSSARRLTPGTSGTAAEVLRRFASAGVVVEAVDVTCADIPVPSFLVRVLSEALPHWFHGSGSHYDADVALTRALTEAAQSRTTAIAGARDDVPSLRYAGSKPATAVTPSAPVSTDRLIEAHDSGPFAACSADIGVALHRVVDALQCIGVPVLRADLTDRVLGVPVVRVAAPGLTFAERHGHG
jgi:ribosomal protein S12 methylthiotransferase accessory factor